MKKGIIIKYLCSNPSCSYSGEHIEQRETLNIVGKSAKFKVIDTCPKCRSAIELRNFISGNVEITEDDI